MGTKMPPPPTPPTFPNADPRNPTMLPTIIFHPNFILCTQHKNKNNTKLIPIQCSWRTNTTPHALPQIKLLL